MIVVTRRAFAECGGFTVWKMRRPKQRSTLNKRAKLLLNLPFGFGLFWTFGAEWLERSQR